MHPGAHAYTQHAAHTAASICTGSISGELELVRCGESWPHSRAMPALHLPLRQLPHLSEREVCGMPHEQQHLQCSTFCIFHDGVATASGWSHMSGALAAPGRATAGVPRPRVDDDDEQASVAPEVGGGGSGGGGGGRRGGGGDGGGSGSSWRSSVA